MQNLKSRLEKKDESPPRRISQKIISYEKGFKHFLKQKREKILGSNEPREEVQPLSGKTKSQTYQMPSKVTKDELELISYFYEDIPKVISALIQNLKNLFFSFFSIIIIMEIFKKQI